MPRIAPDPLRARRAALDLVGDRPVPHREDLEAAGVGDDRPVPAHEARARRRSARSAPDPARGTGGTCSRAPSRSRARPASETSSVLTTAFVASGTKAGVRTSPCASPSVPVRARDPGSRVWMENDGAKRAEGKQRARHGGPCCGAIRRPRPRSPAARRRAPAIVILRGLRCSGFGTRTSSTPFSNSALTASGSIPLGSVSEREKHRRPLQAVEALLASPRAPPCARRTTVRRLSSSSIVTSDSVMPGRSARSTKWSLGLDEVHRRRPAAIAAVAAGRARRTRC